MVKLQKVEPVLVQHREMGGNDDVLCVDGTAVRDSGVGRQFLYRGVFKDMQILRDAAQKLQRMELLLLAGCRCQRFLWLPE